VSYILNGSHWNLGDPQSIPNLLLAHLYLTLVSVGIGLVIAFPIALLIARFVRLRPPVFGTATFFYTIPSLAFVAFLLPTTGLRATTIIIPLVLYTQIVLIRNIVAAIQAIDPALVEVGRAMGMNRTQVLLRVVLPLALPVVIAGLRVATVTTIGIASIAPLIGVDDLGTLIFQGFNFSYNDEIVAGAILVTALAIGADLLLLALQAALGRGREILPVVRY
jgi:osmoprotectant transport system permease protein